MKANTGEKMQFISISITIAFTLIAALHIYWALGFKIDIRNVVPVVNGEPLFRPGPFGTFAVAIVLCCFATVSLGLGFPEKVPVHYLPFFKISGYSISIVLLVRSVGDFKYAGFFKRIKGSNFAKYDSWLYSPFCLTGGGSFLYLAINLH